jgi:hypothetical protein
MANMYNQPKQSQFMDSYVSQYVPLPFEEMQKTLLVKQDQYNRMEEYQQNAQIDFAGIEGIQGVDAEYLKEKNNELSSFVQSIEGKDLAAPDISKSIRETVRKITADPNLRTIQANMAKYKEFQANYKKRVEEDGSVRNENMYGFMKSLNNYKNVGFAAGELPDPTIHKDVDEFKDFQKYFEMMEPEERDSIGSLSYDSSEGGGKAYYTNTTKGRSAKRVSAQVLNVLEDARSSAAGQQAIRRYQMEMELQGKKPTSKGAMEYLASQIAGVGSGYVFESTTSSDKAAAYNRKNDKEAQFVDGITQLFSPKTIEGSTGLQYDKEGNIVGRDGVHMSNIASVVWNGGVAGLTNGSTLALVAGLIKGGSKLEAKQAAEKAPKIIIAGAVNGMSPKQIVDQSMKQQSLETLDYVKASDVDNASKVLFNDGGGTWINSSIIDKKGNKVPARQAITSTLGLDHDAEIGEIVEALSKSGNMKILGHLKPGNPFAAKGAHISLGGESFIVDYSNLYRPKTEADRVKWEKDRASHELAKLKTELVREDYDVDKQGNKVKVYDIWNFSKDTFDTYTESEYQKLFEKQMQKYKK